MLMEYGALDQLNDTWVVTYEGSDGFCQTEIAKGDHYMVTGYYFGIVEADWAKIEQAYGRDMDEAERMGWPIIDVEAY